MKPRCLGLRWRLLFANLLLFVLLTVTLAILGQSIDDLSGTLRKGTYTSRAISGAQSMEKNVLNVETGQRGYIITGDDEFLEPWQFGQDELKRVAPLWLERVEAETGDTAEAEAIIEEIDGYLEEYAVPLVKQARGGATGAELRTRLPEGKRRVDAIRQAFTEFNEPRIARIQDDDRLAREAAENAKWLARALWAAMAFALVLVALFLARTIVRPIDRVRAGADAVAGGRLDVHIDGGSLKETAALAASFNAMVQELAVARELVERKQLEVEKHSEALERSNADLEQFAYAAAHDLQEPLRTVASYTELLARRYKGQLDDDADDFIDYAVDGARRMQTLIRDLLSYSRLNTKTKPPEPVHVSQTVEQVKRSLEVRIRELDATVEVAGDPVVHGDASQLEMLFQNLLGNAVKFHGEAAPVVRVEAVETDEPGMVELRVSDNGIGIEPEYRERVFRMFQRLNHRSEYDGTGIGLALCKRIVERHGGTIRIVDADGPGTTFAFTLPTPPA